MRKTSHYHFEPAARLISAIGKDLIKDIPASIVELVKNSYDAEATRVDITFQRTHDNLHISINDNGHGMSIETIKNSWMVPGTSFKLEKNFSPNLNRPYQGRKGIGRYATAILGNLLELESVQNNTKTIAKIDWKEFERKEFLKDVNIELTTEASNLTSGTCLKISGGKEYSELLTEKVLDEIDFELQKLISPIKNKNQDDFDVYIHFINVYSGENDYKNRVNKIEQFSILDLFHYRLYGSISNEGHATIKYENHYSNPTQTENFDVFIPLQKNEKNCGEVEFDFRVYDKDRSGIDSLLSRKQGIEVLERAELKKLLNLHSGVGIYRNGFRIRPHGDSGFDWLRLDNRRVQSPSKRIGSDQTIGFITIEAEEYSHLEEKSARDGLKDSEHYERLKSLMKNVITELENRRTVYRQMYQKKKKLKTSVEYINSLTDFSSINKYVNLQLEDGLGKIKNNPEEIETVVKEIKESIASQVEKLTNEKEQNLKKITEIIAMYQGQATVGKIVTVVLHEGRNSVGYLFNQLPRIKKWIEPLLRKEEDNRLTEKIDSRLTSAVNQTISLENLFKKIEPLTRTRRSTAKTLNLHDIVKEIEILFEKILTENEIKIYNTIPKNTIIYGTLEDYRMSFTNLIENSIYWLKRTPMLDRKITISCEKVKNKLCIDIIDNGPGISETYITSGSIFEPGFSGKSEENEGTGLGLAISGEAISRNNGRLKAIYSENGAYFSIEIPFVEGE
ncbi:sensor histidine kinase [Exiguobacterium sp. UBA3968]|uniref:sensor histidine kinase n=1 Tax=Exiguobacterium sp. UBA3968 TaxID=1946492 RepID=UPI0025BB15A3|nr:sensor histidine kinase [Exiguobacterium sp. UBA3968]